MVTITTPIIENNVTRRRFAIGDVHGCSKTLRKMVDDVLQLKPEDTLYLLGDYIDRGPDCKGVLDYLMQLKDSGFDIRPLMGNHEKMLLNAVDDPAARILWYGNGGWATLKEFGVDSPDAIPQRYLDFLADLPYFATTEDYVFVHSGLDFRTQDPLKDTSPEFMIWSREYKVDASKIGGRTLVTGHTVEPLFSILESLKTHRITLDNGCYDKEEIGSGSLVALYLDRRTLVVQKSID